MFHDRDEDLIRNFHNIIRARSRLGSEDKHRRAQLSRQLNEGAAALMTLPWEECFALIGKDKSYAMTSAGSTHSIMTLVAYALDTYKEISVPKFGEKVKVVLENTEHEVVFIRKTGNDWQVIFPDGITLIVNPMKEVIR